MRTASSAARRGVPAHWGHSVEIAKNGEREQTRAQTPQVHKVALRSAMVMSLDRGGVFDYLSPTTTSPARSTSPRRTRCLSAISCAPCAARGGCRWGLPATRAMAAIGAFVLRSDTELLLKSRRVMPGWHDAAQDLVWRVRTGREG